MLFIDIETSGKPVRKAGCRRCESYPDPKYLIAYEKSRLLEITIKDTETLTLFCDITNLPKSSFTTNYDKYIGGTNTKSISSVLEDVYPHIKSCDFVVGQNVLFDLNILASEYFRESANAQPLIEIGLLDEDIFMDAYEKIMLLIRECRYACTLEMATSVGVDPRFSRLADLVSNYNTDFNYRADLEELKYHNSLDDVIACEFVYGVINKFMNRIPQSIMDITDEIYPTSHLGDPDAKTEHELELKLKPAIFDFYHEKLESQYSVMYGSGRCVFSIKEIKKVRLFSLDSKYKLDGKTRYCNLLIDDYIDICGKCGSETIGSGYCSECSDAINVIFEKATEFINMKCDGGWIKFTDVKSLIPKMKHKRSGFLELEIKKNGRSNTVQMEKISFYIDNRIYEQFSLKVGSVKI